MPSSSSSSDDEQASSRLTDVSKMWLTCPYFGHHVKREEMEIHLLRCRAQHHRRCKSEGKVVNEMNRFCRHNSDHLLPLIELMLHELFICPDRFKSAAPVSSTSSGLTEPEPASSSSSSASKEPEPASSSSSSASKEPEPGASSSSSELAPEPEPEASSAPWLKTCPSASASSGQTQPLSKTEKLMRCLPPPFIPAPPEPRPGPSSAIVRDENDWGKGAHAGTFDMEKATLGPSLNNGYPVGQSKSQNKAWKENKVKEAEKKGAPALSRDEWAEQLVARNRQPGMAAALLDQMRMVGTWDQELYEQLDQMALQDFLNLENEKERKKKEEEKKKKEEDRKKREEEDKKKQGEEGKE